MNVKLAEDSPAGQPSFTFSVMGEPAAGVSELAVYRCRPTAVQRPVWHIKRADPSGGGEGAAARVARVTYGVVPPGYEAAAPALPLEPRRCYEVAVPYSGINGWGLPGTKDFYLERDGRVRGVRGETAFEIAMKQERGWHRATVGCLRGYRRARSAGDTAAVDTRAYPVADTSVSCGFLRASFADGVNGAVSSERAALHAIGFVAAMTAIIAGTTAIDRALRKE